MRDMTRTPRSLLPYACVVGIVLLSVMITDYYFWATTGTQSLLVPPDYSITWSQALQALRGHPLHVYAGSPLAGALPALPWLLAAVASGLIHMGVVPAHYGAQHAPIPWSALMWPLYVIGALSVLGVHRLLVALDVPWSRHRAMLVIYSVLVAVPTLALAGHPEDLATLGLLCWAVALGKEGRWSGGAAVMLAAVLLQDYAAVAVPIYLACSPAGQRVRVAAITMVPTGALGLALLVGGGSNARLAMLDQPTPYKGQHTVSHYIDPSMMLRPEWRGTLERYTAGGHGRSLTIVLGVALAIWLWRRGGTWLDGCWAIGVALASRGLTDPTVWTYYMAPGLIVLAILAMRCDSPDRRAGAVALAALPLIVLAPDYIAKTIAVPWPIWMVGYASCWMGLAGLARPWAATTATMSDGRQVVDAEAIRA